MICTQAKVSISRISEFLNSDELDFNTVNRKSDGGKRLVVIFNLWTICVYQYTYGQIKMYTI